MIKGGGVEKVTGGIEFRAKEGKGKRGGGDWTREKKNREGKTVFP